MKQRPMLVDSGLPHVDCDDFRCRRPTLDVRTLDDAETIPNVPSPRALVTSNNAWRAEYVDRLEAGDWVTTVGSGYDRFPVDALEARGVALTHAPGSNAVQVAEHVFAMVLSYTRCLWTYGDRQRTHEWRKDSGEVTQLAGARCCVVGLGHVGEAVARRAVAFEMSVTGVKRTVDGYDGAADEVYAPDHLHVALDGADLVVLALPRTESTVGLIGRRELEATDDDAIVVNVGRGPVLDMDALLSALDRGTLGSACLDVTDPEPLPPDSPLWDRPDILLTPHVAWRTDQRTDQILGFVLPQYDRWRVDKPLEHRVV